MFLEKSAFVPSKPLPHSPKISPSSIPNPNPSVSTTKQIESGYPNYGGYLYSVPGYSAFQPVSYPSIIPPNQSMPIMSKNSDFTPYPLISKENQEAQNKEQLVTPSATTQAEKIEKPQNDFEEHFKPEIVPASPLLGDSNIQISESKMSITSLAQGSGATITVPSQNHHNTDSKKKPTERFSLKTSIPISKIDLKCVNNAPESGQKKVPVPFHPAFQTTKVDNSKIEIQSNVVIKSGSKETNDSTDPKQNNAGQMNNICTLLNAAEAISKSDSTFRMPEPKPEAPKEIKDPPLFPNTTPNTQVRPIFNPLNIEPKKVSFSNPPADGPHTEQNNSILFIQNKNPSTPKMVLAIQQQSPKVLLQRTNFESKNLLAPSRLSSQLKKSKDDNDSLSKVVALKRLHQENCDENDFENLITENQIYGNKIVVKEKSQGTLQEQDLKNKNKLNDKIPDTKNVVLQPNIVYLSNLQFPANLMMLKNNTKHNQANDATKINKILGKEIKITTSEAGTMTNTDGLNLNNNTKHVGKGTHLFNSNCNVLQTMSNKNKNSDIVIQTNQKVIMNPQIVYQIPKILETENKTNQPAVTNKDYPNMTGANTDYSKPVDPSKQSDKLYIACPYQIDSKLQPKIVITNIRPKITKIDETSSLDLYEKKKRMRRLKHLTNRDNKTTSKPEIKKSQTNVDPVTNIITPEKIKAEIYREFVTRVTVSDEYVKSDSEYGDDELDQYEEIIKEYGAVNESDEGKQEFLANLNLGTHSFRKDKEMELQENILRKDSVASAYVAAGRLDRLYHEDNIDDVNAVQTIDVKVVENKIRESPIMLKKKQLFLSRLSLMQVSTQLKQGFEKTWQEIIKERNRRSFVNDHSYILKAPKYVPEAKFNTNTQLQMLTEIKRCVNENNNLIKKRLDLACEDENLGDSIKVLAEKNFSELDRLSKMADRCVKLYSGQETKKRDLNPGFDSENIQTLPAIEQQINYPQINIPDISKIISLKSCTETSIATSSQATSMDEPRSSAAGVSEMFSDGNEKTREVGCQIEPKFTWADLENFMTNYKLYDNTRKKEISDLHRRTTALRVECAHVTLSASRSSDRARALLAERHHLADEERAVRASVATLTTAIHAIKNY